MTASSGRWNATDEARLDARMAVWAPTLVGPLRALYGDAAAEVGSRLLATAAAAAQRRRAPLRDLDIRREVDPTWFHDPSMIGYVAYAERFGGTLPGVGDHLDYLSEMHVTYVHLMNVLRARDGDNDGGYAIVDYHDVERNLGRWEDLVALADEMHERGMSLCIDVVMNHTAAEHEWAEAARSGSSRHRDYYLVFPDRTMPDRFEETLPEVFPEMAPGNFTWNDELNGWVWTSFYDYQWDLNYANPEVLHEMLVVILELANAGVDVLRLDAVAFTWKRLGTNCQNQPEAHLIAQIYRSLISIAAPGVLLKAEAIVAPADLLPYLGAHRLFRPECHLAYHNQLMVNIWSGLAMGDASLMRASMKALAPTPVNAGWVNYVRCHDDIGWAISDEAADAAGLSGAAHRSFLAAYYRGDFPGSFADGEPFSNNPANGDERTCGTAAALCGVGRAQRSGDESALANALARLRLAYAVIFGFPGIPLIYMGDELAMDNDRSYLDDPHIADDSRWIHRPAMDWRCAAASTQPTSVAGRARSLIDELIDARRACPAASAGGETWIHDLPDPAVFAWARIHPVHGRLYGLANFSGRVAVVPGEACSWAGLTELTLVYGAGSIAPTASGAFELAPYAVCWFADRADVTV